MVVDTEGISIKLVEEDRKTSHEAPFGSIEEYFEFKVCAQRNLGEKLLLPGTTS